MLQAGPPSLHYYCAVVLHSYITLPPVGHSSNHHYHCCQLTDNGAVFRIVIVLLRFSFDSYSYLSLGNKKWHLLVIVGLQLLAFLIRLLLFRVFCVFNPLNAELNPICHFLALLFAHPILHVSRIRVNASHDVYVCRISENPVTEN